MLIIFDCDGVLVDSESLAAEVFSCALKTINIDMAAEECLSEFHGMTLKDCYARLEKNKNLILPDHFPEFLEQETRKRFDQDLRAVAGVESVLGVLQKNGVARCVASNGGKNKIINSLRVTGLLNYFDYFFSADDVPAGKPDPALFIYAANNMGFATEDVVVIEDSFAGYSAAKSAGMKTVLYRPSFFCEGVGLEKINAMAELLSLLETKFGFDFGSSPSAL